jgi:amino acid transporter
LVLTNLIGADVFARIQNMLATVLISAMVLMGLVSITGVVEPHPTLTGTSVNWGVEGVIDGSFIGLVALAMWLMVGVEFICPMIKEVKNPSQNIPRAMKLSLFAIFSIFLVFVVGASMYLSTENLLESPIPYLDYANAVFGQSGLFIATVMALAATCSTVNTLLASIPRMLHGMAEQGQAFPQLKATNRFGVPWRATLLIAGLTTIPYLLVDIDSLITLVIAATTSYLLAYMVAHVNVLVLRKRLPDFDRPYRTPFYPLPQLLGIAAMIYVALNNSPSPEMTTTVYSITGGILLVLGLITAFWVKCVMKRGLFEPDQS